MLSATIASTIESTVAEVAAKVHDVQRAFTWEDFQEYKLWRELCACLLGSRVQFELARSCTHRLDRSGLLRILQRSDEYSRAEAAIKKELQKPIYLPRKTNGSKRSYTFPNAKSHQLRLTAERIYGAGREIKELLMGCHDEYCAREVMVGFACGIGPKQSSLFLRNVGFADNLAILDSHVLRYMELVKLIRSGAQSMGSILAYEKTESTLQRYAKRMDTKMSNLDTAIWIVMRVYQREFAR